MRLFGVCATNPGRLLMLDASFTGQVIGSCQALSEKQGFGFHPDKSIQEQARVRQSFEDVRAVSHDSAQE